MNFKIGESGNIDITYNNQNVALASTVTSSNEDVVKVNNNRLTAVGEGTATITVDYDTAKSGIDNGVKSYSFDVKVTKDVADKSLTVNTEDLLLDQITDYKLYTVANGLPSSVTSNSYSALDDNGKLYIACREGVSCVNINHYFDQKIKIIILFCKKC